MGLLTKRTLTLLALLTLGLTTACGGGGSSGDATSEEIDLRVDIDAFSDDGATLNTSAATVYVGDTEGNTNVRGLLLFTLSEIPAGAEIIGATLACEFGSHYGTPTDNGKLQCVRYDPTHALGISADDFDAPVLAHDPEADAILVPENAPFRLGAFEIVKHAHEAGADRIHIRVQYESGPTADGGEDGVEFHTGNQSVHPAPTLRVVYRR